MTQLEPDIGDNQSFNNDIESNNNNNSKTIYELNQNTLNESKNLPSLNYNTITTQKYNTVNSYNNNNTINNSDSNTLTIQNNNSNNINNKEVVLVKFDYNDPDNPQNWPKSKKLLIAASIAISGFSIVIDSSGFAGSDQAIAENFPTADRELITLGLSVYVLGFATGPLIAGPLSELYGRLLIFHISFPICIIWLLCCVFAPNIGSLVVFRFLAAAFGASIISNAAMISDMYMAAERGKMMTWFITGLFFGTSLGPTAGGYISQYGGYRWALGFQCLIVVLCYTIAAPFIKETYQPVILKQKAKKLNQQNTNPDIVYKTESEILDDNSQLSDVLYTAMTRPFILLFKEPIILALSTWVALVYGILYLTFEAYPIVYAQQRHFTSGETGLTYLSICVGIIVGTLLVFYVFNPMYTKNVRSVSQANRAVTPELRLPMAILGGICFPVSLFAFAWLTLSNVHYMASVCIMAIFGLGIELTFLSVQNYIVDCYQLYAASALAANNVYRSIVGAVFPLFAVQMYQGLGVQWATMLIAFLSLACVPLPFALLKYGARLRAASKYSGAVVDTQKTQMIEDIDDMQHGAQETCDDTSCESDYRTISPSDNNNNQTVTYNQPQIVIQEVV